MLGPSRQSDHQLVGKHSHLYGRYCGRKADSKRLKIEQETMSTETKAHQFQKGNPGGPGRPKGKVDYRAILDKCVTAEAFYLIMDRAVQDAISGSPATRARARAFVVSFVLAPIPKTVKVESAEDSSTDSRKLLDALVEVIPAETLQAVLDASEKFR